jgi:hypothetical protein
MDVAGTTLSKFKSNEMKKGVPRDYVLLEQQSDVVIVLWASSILPILRLESYELDTEPPYWNTLAVVEVYTTTNSGAQASNMKNTSIPKYNVVKSLLI